MTDRGVPSEHLPSAQHPFADDFVGAVVPARAWEAPPVPITADLDNVIVFAPRRRAGEKPAPAILLGTDDRPAPQPAVPRRRRKSALLVAGSLAVHSGLLVAFLHEPTPHASIGLEVLSVELVLGTNKAAGVAPLPAQSEDTVNTREVPFEDKPEAPQKETARRETNNSIQPVREPVEQTRLAEPAAAQPLPAEIPPEPQKEPELAVTLMPAEKLVTIAAVPKENPETRQVQRPKPEPKPTVKHTRDDGKNARDRAAPTSPQLVASSGVGRGRSDADTNYRGLVSAHLARHKQFPAAARSRGDQGTATVTFSLDGGGRVTSVRLARGSGIASIDQETQAMVRRASPFPAPPSGRPQSFTVPVQFYLR